MMIKIIYMIIPAMHIQGGGLVITTSQTAKETLIYIPPQNKQKTSAKQKRVETASNMRP